MTYNSDTHSSDDPVLHFLGIDGEHSAPFFPAWNLDKVRRVARNTPFGDRDVRYGIKAEDPAEAGWGVIFAAGIGRDVREELAPLLERRKKQAGELFGTYEFEEGETLKIFRRRIKAGIGRVSPERLPYYLLLVGDPEQIPFGIQYDLDMQHAVGRIAFPDAASYGRYARSVCEHETRTTTPLSGLHLFSFDREDDPPTEQALAELARPLATEFNRRPGFDFAFTVGAEATTERFAESLVAGPSVVFTIGHSFLLKNGVEGQDQWQGSLITGSWRGGRIRSRDVYRAADVPDNADLCGRIFYLYGCHTVGTPETDSFEQNGTPQRLAPRPFLAPLPLRLLAPPKGKGALAVIGQVDRALPSTSLGWDGVPQIDTFVDTLRAVSDGVPVGRALESFGQRYASLAIETLRAMNSGSPSDSMTTWTAYHDARAVALLGDPLVATKPDQTETS